ncbi:MAG: hypothetical protein H6719_29855 [Sandaracinaceae bacterium]|nr:hypothetical protein [Sandaracinaceae bacterium]
MEGVHAYYESALAALRYVEHRAPTNRRFGADADLLWASFHGHLADVDRIELLVRDADAQWPGSLGARGVFALDGAEDDAFGQDWSPLDSVRGAELWRDALATPAPENLGAALAQVAAPWRTQLAPFDPPAITASSRLVVAGPSAFAALAQAFEGRAELDWADQVAVVASAPAHRQLAGFVGAALNATKRVSILAANETPTTSLRGRSPIISPDASPEDAAHAKSLAGA